MKRRDANFRVAPVMRPLFLLAIVTIPLASCGKSEPMDRLDDNAVGITASSSAATTPAKRCASSAIYDLIKRELFRRAAQARGNDDTVYRQVAGTAILRVERPVVESDDEGQGAISCSASIALDLPPGVTVSGGRSSLSSDLDYVLQPAANGSGDVVTLPRPEAITVPLATAARTVPTPFETLDDNSATPASPVTIHRSHQRPDPLEPVDDPLAPTG